MSDQPAAQLLASYFRRWSNIEEAKQNLAEDSKGLMKELKDRGFDAKATRAVFRDKRLELTEEPADQSKREEQEAMYDLYWSALNDGLKSPSARPAPAHVEKIEEFRPKSEAKSEPVNRVDDAVYSFSSVERKEQASSQPAGSGSEKIPAPIPHSLPAPPPVMQRKAASSASHGDAATLQHGALA